MLSSHLCFVRLYDRDIVFYLLLVGLPGSLLTVMRFVIYEAEPLFSLLGILIVEDLHK